MPRSRKPSVWIVRRKLSTNYYSYHVRFERDGSSFPSLMCGPDRSFAVQVRDSLRSALWSRAPEIESLLKELAAGKIRRHAFARDLLAVVAEQLGHAPGSAGARATSDRVLLRGRGGVRTLGELVDEYLRESQKYKAPRAAEHDARALGRLVAYLGLEAPLDEITPAVIREFHKQMTGKAQKPGAAPTALSKTSEAMYLFAIRAAFNRGRKSYKMMTNDPFEEYPIFRVGSKGRYIHDDEFEKVRPLAAMKIRDGRSLWEFLDVMRHQGLRSGAVSALDGRMINRKTWHLHLIKPARLGIGREAELKGTELYAPIHPAVLPLFKAAPASGLIFAAWHRNDVAKQLRRICAAAGVTPFRPHDLKHTFVTNFLKGGGTLAMCSAITGTTETMLKRVYGHLEGRVPASEMLRVSYSSATAPHKSKAAKP